MQLHIDDLMPYLYRLQAITPDKDIITGPFQLDIHGLFTHTDQLDRALTSHIAKRVKSLESRYTPIWSTDEWIWPKGCFKSRRGDTVTFREKSEWFRKIVSDYVYHQRNPTPSSAAVLTFIIPKLWLREHDLPNVMLWLRENNLAMHPVHQARAAALLEKYPLDKVKEIPHSITRRYYLRYYVRTGDLTLDEFRYWRHHFLSDGIPRLERRDGDGNWEVDPEGWMG